MSKAGAIAATSALHLLEQYREGTSFFWSSPQHTMLAQGERSRFPVAAVKQQVVSDSTENMGHAHDNHVEGVHFVIEQVRKMIQEAQQTGLRKPIVVGAIPFDPSQSSAELFIPETVQWAEPPSHAANGSYERRPAAAGCEIEEVPGAEMYQRSVDHVLKQMEQGELDKVVLSRTLRVVSDDLVDTHQLLRNLFRDNAHGYTFAVPMRKVSETKSTITTNCHDDNEVNYQETRTFIGASPELLVTRKGTIIRANPLAGSAPRSDDPAEDRRRADALLTSAKDRHEHAVVIDAVAAALRPLCKQLIVPAEPSLIQTSTMWHLSTEIHGELLDRDISSLEVAFALHPTPAICGTPVLTAREVIGSQEPFDRGLFTGMVGWCDSEGDGEWAVTIRCAEVEGNELRLFAGAGIVAGSTPEAELAETSAKFRTMLLAMGLDSTVPHLKEE